MHKHYQDWAHNADICQATWWPAIERCQAFLEGEAYVGWLDMRDLGAVLDREGLAAAS